eukprot:gene5397-3886_t
MGLFHFTSIAGLFPATTTYLRNDYSIRILNAWRTE